MFELDVFKKYCLGKRVLSVGFLGDWHLKKDRSGWLFAQMCSLNSQVVGLDLNKEGIEVLKKDGMSNVEYGNAELMFFEQGFDVVGVKE